MNPQGSMNQGSMGTTGSTSPNSTMGQGSMNQGSINQGSTPALMQLPASEARVDEIPTGAILELRAKDSSQIMALRSAVKQDVHALRQGCLQQGMQNR